MEATPVLCPTNDNFFDFAWIPAHGRDVPANKCYESRLIELADRAQPEVWSFDPSQPVAILGNYLRYTFKRLVREAKIEQGIDSTSCNVAAFNTGLFTPNYEAIHAF